MSSGFGKRGKEGLEKRISWKLRTRRRQGLGAKGWLKLERRISGVRNERELV